MRLSYGLGIAAALITGGVALFYATNPRSTIDAPTIVELKEGRHERDAAIGTWPFTGTATGGWNFTHFDTQTMVITHADIKDLMDWGVRVATNFVKEYDATNVTYWTAAGLFQAAGVGPADGTQTLYTVGLTTTNGTNWTPVYSNTPWITINTNLLWEMYRLQCLMTTTVRNVSGLTVSRAEYNAPFFLTNYVYEESGVYSYAWEPERNIPWYSNAFWHHHFDDVPDADFQGYRDIAIADFTKTNVAYNPTNYAYSFDSCNFYGAYCFYSDAKRYSGGVYSDDWWSATALLYSDNRWRKDAVCSSLVWSASFPSGVVAQANFLMLTTGSVTVAFDYQSAESWDETSYSNTVHAIVSNSIIPAAAYSFVDISTAAVPIGIVSTASLAMAYPGFDTASWNGYDASSNGVYTPKIVGIVQNIPQKAVINWTFTRCNNW